MEGRVIRSRGRDRVRRQACHDHIGLAMSDTNVPAETSDCELICIAPDRVAEFLPYARPYLERAAQRSSEASVAAIEGSLLAGGALLWLVWGQERLAAIVVTQLVDTAAGRVCVIVSCAGAAMGRWLSLLERIERYAAEEGCVAVRIYGRKGWARLLPGYTVARFILERRL